MIHNSNYISFKNGLIFAQERPCHTLPHLANCDIMNVHKTMPEKLHNLKEVAKMLSVSERSVYRYIHSKRLRASKVGYWRISDDDVKKFLADNANDKRSKPKKKPTKKQ